MVLGILDFVIADRAMGGRGAAVRITFARLLVGC